LARAVSKTLRWFFTSKNQFWIFFILSGLIGFGKDVVFVECFWGCWREGFGPNPSNAGCPVPPTSERERERERERKRERERERDRE
jgi:hypothetical protein